MFEYRYDAETGALVLEPDKESTRVWREPRPVFWQELDRIGLGAHFDYPRGCSYCAPIMWGELNRYYYRGRLIATLKAKGRVFDAGAELILNDDYTGERELRDVDVAAMNELNAAGVKRLEAISGDRMRASYERWQGATHYVSFSGGKDSSALLSVAMSSLSPDAYTVIFADTDMETPETYEIARITRYRIETSGGRFIWAQSPFRALESWKLFAPPSRRMRWCCSVHKSAPQTNALRAIMQERGSTSSVAFCGVRWEESPRRSTYDFETLGVKVAGQVSSYPILDWHSGEVWAYLFYKGEPINRAYWYGFRRVGCLICPMTNGQSTAITLQTYPKESAPYIELINRADKRKSDAFTYGYFKSNGWRIRVNGNYLADNPTLYRDRQEDDGTAVIWSKRRTTDWREWFKTLGQLEEQPRRSDQAADVHEYVIKMRKKTGRLTVVGDVNDDEAPLEFRAPKLVGDRSYKSRVKMLVRRATYCVACRTCESNCQRGMITFENGRVKVSDSCIHCYQCLSTEHEGCVRYQSLRKSRACFDE